MELALQVRHVSRRKAGNMILHDVSFDVCAGEIFCLLGESGAGKTTLLRVIAGLEHPTSGTVSIDGKVVNKTPVQQRGIGYLFQSTEALFPHLNVFANVAFPLSIRNTPRAEIRQRVSRLLEQVGLMEKARRLPDTLSGGEKQRAALARALVYDPALLLLDEPLSSLDNANRSNVLWYLARIIPETKVSCVYVTHDEREALFLGNRVGVLDDGRIVEENSASELFRAPQHEATAKLSTGWNVIESARIGNDMFLLPDGSLPSALQLTSRGFVKNPQYHAGGDSLARPAALGVAIEATSVSAAPPNAPESIGIPVTLRYGFFAGDHTRLECDLGGRTVVAKWGHASPPPPSGSRVYLVTAAAELRPLETSRRSEN